MLGRAFGASKLQLNLRHCLGLRGSPLFFLFLEEEYLYPFEVEGPVGAAAGAASVDDFVAVFLLLLLEFFFFSPPIAARRKRLFCIYGCPCVSPVRQ